MEACRFCGAPEFIGLDEIYDSGEFSVGTCCADLYDHLIVSQDEEGWLDLLRHLDVEALTGQAVRRIVAADASLRLDYPLQIAPVTLRAARAFVARHHRHAPSPPPGWRFGASVRNGLQTIAIVMVGRPVARLIDASTTVEINRLCIRRDIPAALRQNAASMLLGWAAREARKRKFRRVVTYTLQSESGTSLRAAGFKATARTRGGSWDTPSRRRVDRHPTTPKIRWERELRATH